jgi:hypothetical protein
MQSKHEKQILGREFWVELVMRFEQGPRTTRHAFAQGEGVNYHTFCDWLRRLRAERREHLQADRAPDALAPVRFVELTPAPAAAARAAVVLEIGQARMHLGPELCCPHWLATLILATGERGRAC